MVGLKPLEFSECITDSPAFRDKLHIHEKELERTSQQIKGLVKEVKDLLSAARHLSKAQRALSQSLSNFEFECIGEKQTDDEECITKSLRVFGQLIEHIEEQRDMMLERAYDQIIVPLEKFRKEHIGGVKEGKKKFEKQTAKFCLSQERYLSLSTKKHDAILQEADAALEMERKAFFEASLDYVFLLQEVQERKKFEFVEPLLGFMYGWLTFYHQGHEVANDFKPYMSDLQSKLQKTRDNFQATRDRTVSLKEKMQEQASKCGGSNKQFTKEGYLYLMEKKAFGTMTWTKQYCMYKKDTKELTMMAYNQITRKYNPAETIKLSSCVRRMSESIDKRFCFDVTTDDRGGVQLTFQALSAEDRKQWMDVMDGKEPTYDIPGKTSKVEETTLDEIGFRFVTQCIETLEKRGMEETGLYRLVGLTSKVNKLLQMGLDRRKSDKLPTLEDEFEWETKTITSALKTYLRNLPEPLMTFRYHNAFIAAAKQESKSQRIHDVHTLVYRLPKENFSMLNLLIKHLKKVTLKSEKNLMTISNLSTCFGPTLLRPEEETVAAIMETKFFNLVIEILIENYEKIFSGPPDSSETNQDSSKFTSNLGNGSSPNHFQNSISHNHIQGASSQIRIPIPHGVNQHQNYWHGSIVPHPPQRSRTSQPTQAPHPIAHVVHSYEIPNPSTLSGSIQNIGSHVSSPTPHKPAPRMGTSTRSESNLLNLAHIQPYSSTMVYPKQQYLYGSRGSCERPDPPSGISNSAETISLSSRDLLNHVQQKPHHISPQKSKRGGVIVAPHLISLRPSHDSGTPSSSSTTSGRSSPVTPTVRVRTLYACQGENDGELSFEPNQIITNVRPSMEPGWLEGTLNGKTGLIPENYVEKLP